MVWYKKKYGAHSSAPVVRSDEIRKAVKNWLKQEKIIIDEVKLPAGNVADLLCINPIKKHIIGVEIKATSDDIRLLRRQLEGYMACCSAVVVVTTYPMLAEVLPIVGDFGGVGVAVYNKYKGKVTIEVVRNVDIWECPHVGCSWITKRSKLYQFRYILEDERMWGM